MSLKLTISKRLEERLRGKSEKARVNIEEVAMQPLYKGQPKIGTDLQTL